MLLPPDFNLLKLFNYKPGKLITILQNISQRVLTFFFVSKYNIKIDMSLFIMQPEAYLSMIYYTHMFFLIEQQ